MDHSKAHIGIDFGQTGVHCALIDGDGRLLVKHRRFDNSIFGLAELKQWFLEIGQGYGFSELNVSGEATSYYWLPMYLGLEEDIELRQAGLKLYLHNPRWVKKYTQSFSHQNKSDKQDPFFIADYTRTHHTYVWQSQRDWLPLRWYTRTRYRFNRELTRLKNTFLIHLFIRCSGYSLQQPFSDPFGQTSCQVLSRMDELEDWAEMPVEDLAAKLVEWSHNHLPDPMANAERLQAAARSSFRLDPALNYSLDHVLQLLLENIRFMHQQIEKVDALLTQQATQHPQVACLDTIPGIGLVFATGLAAEIGDLQRYFEGERWDPRHQCPRPKNLRDVEDEIAKAACLWWPSNSSGSFEAEERHMPRDGNPYLRYYLVAAADRIRLSIPAYATYYQRKYDEVPKHKHRRALVLTARKAVGLFVGLLHRQEAFDPKEVA